MKKKFALALRNRNSQIKNVRAKTAASGGTIFFEKWKITGPAYKRVFCEKWSSFLGKKCPQNYLETNITKDTTVSFHLVEYLILRLYSKYINHLEVLSNLYYNYHYNM